MKDVKFKKIKESLYIDTYIINQKSIIINDIKIDLETKNAYSTLSHYLKISGTTLNDYLINEINGDICIHCGEKINKSNFSRKKFKNYKFCNKCNSEKIRNLYRNKNCIICNKICLDKDIIFSTCGSSKCLNKHRKNINDKISSTHWTKKENYQEIEKKRIKKRKENDILFNRIYIPWNKGKTGIYSKETIEKIRNATIKQMKKGRIKKTKQEKIFEEFLINNKINYTYSYIYKRRQFDFLLHDYKLIVELQGDYWHANPDYWDIYGNDPTKKKLYETQIMKKKDDIIKKQLIKDSKFDFVEFWEYDIHNNFSYVIETLITSFNIKINKFNK